MHQSIISILTGCLCVCTVTISTSTSSTTATSSTPWTSAASSLETLSGSELPTSTTQSVIGSITPTNTLPSTSTADPTSKVETTSDVLTPTIIHTPTTTQLSTGTAEMATVKDTTNTETSVNPTTHLETSTSLTSDTEAAVIPTIISEATTTETFVTPTINLETTTRLTTNTDTSATHTIHSETTMPDTETVPTAYTGTTESNTTYSDTTNQTTTKTESTTISTIYSTNKQTTASPPTANTNTTDTLTINSETTTGPTTEAIMYNMTILHTTTVPTVITGTTDIHTTNTDTTTETTTYTETTVTRIKTETITTVDRSTSTQPVITTPSKCYNVTELFNGNVTISADGKFAIYTCHDGYRLNGSELRTCANGTWSGYDPSCLENCKIPLTFANGNVSLSASNTSATFTCIPGFVLNGSSQMTCGDGNWSAAIPTCHRKVCGNLTDPENGRLIQNGLLYESMVNYTCNNGYYIVGTWTRTCLESGLWSGQTPRCAKVAVSTCTCKYYTDIWGVIWYESLCGQTQWSQCPKGSSGNYTRQCDSKGVWVNFNNTCIREAISNIAKTLNELNATNANSSAIVNVLITMTAATTVNTTTSEKLTGGEVSKLADSLSKVADILKSSTGTVNITTSMTKDFLTSTSNLLEEKDTWKTMKESGTNDGGKILKAVDTLTDVLRKSFEADSTINKTFSTTNIAIELLNMTGNKAIQFPGGVFADTLDWGGERTKTAITFQPSSFNASFATGVLYRNMSDILPTHSSNDSIYTEIRGQVVAFSVSDTSVNLTKNITIQIEHFSPSYTNPQCSFWNEQSSGSGQWSTLGCFFVNSTANLTTCECNHLTNFAVLMSPFVEVDNILPLRLVSIIGISVSIFGLLLTVLLHACLWRQVKNNRSSLLINLCVALLCAYIVFLSGVDRTESKAFCAAVASLLHYIYLVVFCLMLVEGIEIVITVVYVFATKSRARPMIILAWAIPAVIVGISLGVTKTKGYGNENFCWLSIKDGVIWAFVGPTLLIILLNVGSLVIVLRKLFTMKAMENKNFKDKILTSVRSLCVLVPLIGVSWILGIFYVNENLAVMQYVFAVCNGLQGFCIFLIHCVFNPKMRVALCIRYRRFKSEADTKDSRHKRSNATSNSTPDWRNLILETSSYETINASTEIGKIKRPNVDYKPSSSEDNGYHDDNAVGYTSLGMSNDGYTAYTGYNRHAKHFSDKRKAGYLEYRNYTSTEL
ncbi:adhesion G protein-coupled receptor L4-like isoform X2 [Dreissena polymorpha]|uniref:adhesion G protein-coupled receptor L4-like isoform X2 n=1 Tax=Dreissena polymorpha TaxID=45954 RepID=UPI002263F008|nr:adhesion G protein-coupled receptor L4-like isoform X2 [Dreissena polymorpha]